MQKGSTVKRGKLTSWRRRQTLRRQKSWEMALGDRAYRNTLRDVRERMTPAVDGPVLELALREIMPDPFDFGPLAAPDFEESYADWLKGRSWTDRVRVDGHIADDGIRQIARLLVALRAEGRCAEGAVRW